MLQVNLDLNGLVIINSSRYACAIMRQISLLCIKIPGDDVL